MLRSNKRTGIYTYTDGNYTYNDANMYFWFNGIYSANYNLFITDTPVIENNINANSTYENASYQEGSYLLGTSRTQKTWTKKCAAEGLSSTDYKNMMKWLTPGTRGMLFFDNNCDWGWIVVLDNVSDSDVGYNSHGMIVSFTLTFKSIGNYLARNRYNTTTALDFSNEQKWNKPNNNYGIPEIYCGSQTVSGTTRTTDIYIQNLSNEYQLVDIFFNTPKYSQYNFKETVNNIPYVNLDLQSQMATEINTSSVSIYGDSNLVLINNQLAELNNNVRKLNEQYGILQLQSKSPLYCGKYNFISTNLFNYAKISDKTMSGITFKNNNDGTFGISGTATGGAYTNLSYLLHLESGKVYSAKLFGTLPSGITFNLNYNGLWYKTLTNNTFTVDTTGDYQPYIHVVQGTVISETVLCSPMIVESSTIPEMFQPYTPLITIPQTVVPQLSLSYDFVALTRHIDNSRFNTQVFNNNQYPYEWQSYIFLKDIDPNNTFIIKDNKIQITRTIDIEDGQYDVYLGTNNKLQLIETSNNNQFATNYQVAVTSYNNL